MSSPRAYSQDTLAIMDRFFVAFTACVEQGLIRTAKDFCDTHNIARPHFYAQRKHRGRGFFEAGWLSILVRDYGVSANWLLTGKGTMFVQ